MAQFLQIEGSEEIVNTARLEKIGHGKGGIVYRLDEKNILKVLKLNNMNEEKLRDLRESVQDLGKTRLIVPSKTVTDLFTQHPKRQFTLIAGYTTRFIEENPDLILMMSPYEYMEEIFLLKEQIETYFSTNKIAVKDTNPNNILSSGVDGITRLYLIDYDSNITPKGSGCNGKKVVHGNYSQYNDRRLALIMYKVLLNQIVRFNRKRTL